MRRAKKLLRIGIEGFAALLVSGVLFRAYAFINHAEFESHFVETYATAMFSILGAIAYLLARQISVLSNKTI